MSVDSLPIGKELGRGKFGRVVYTKREGNEYALKIIELKSDKDFTSAANEVALLKTLKHENIMSIEDFGFVKSSTSTSGFEMRILMPLAYGGSLRNCLEKKKNASSRQRWTVEDVMNIFSQLANGVAYLHEKKIAHRDLKPDNILQMEEGHFLISDFGISKSFDSRISKVFATAIGTQPYMSPEQFEGHYSVKVDIWSLGCILYELSCLKHPFITLDFNYSLRDQLEGKYDSHLIPDEKAKSIIGKLIVVDIEKRLSAQELLDFMNNTSRSNNNAPGSSTTTTTTATTGQPRQKNDLIMELLKRQASQLNVASSNKQAIQNHYITSPVQESPINQQRKKLSPTSSPNNNNNNAVPSPPPPQADGGEQLRRLPSVESLIKEMKQHSDSSSSQYKCIRTIRKIALASLGNDDNNDIDLLIKYHCDDLILKAMKGNEMNEDIQLYGIGCLWILAEHMKKMKNSSNNDLFYKAELDSIIKAMSNFPSSEAIQSEAFAAVSVLAEINDQALIKRRVEDYILRAMTQFPNHRDIQHRGCSALRRLASGNHKAVLISKRAEFIVCQAMKSFPNDEGVLYRALAALGSIITDSNESIKSNLVGRERLDELIIKAMNDYLQNTNLVTKGCVCLRLLAMTHENGLLLANHRAHDVVVKAMKEYPRDKTIIWQGIGVLWGLCRTPEMSDSLIKQYKIDDLLLRAIKDFYKDPDVLHYSFGMIWALTAAQPASYQVFMNKKLEDYILKSLKEFQTREFKDLHYRALRLMWSISLSKQEYKSVFLKKGALPLIQKSLELFPSDSDIQTNGKGVLILLSKQG